MASVPIMTALLSILQPLSYGVAGAVGGILGALVSGHIRKRTKKGAPLGKPKDFDRRLAYDFIPVPAECVEPMLDVASISVTDVLFDLGSGDGRIVIGAAKRGAKAIGIDLNPKRIAQAKANARSAGVEVEWRQEDFFSANLSEATIIMAYLDRPVLLKLAAEQFPKLSGVRVVTYQDIIPWLVPKRVQPTSTGHCIFVYELS
jgi:SAM-dependent methyltransferase